MNKRALTQEQELTVVELYQGGSPLSGIAVILDVSPETIRKSLLRSGVKCRTSSGTPKTIKPTPTEKVCSTCGGVPQPITNFHKNRNGGYYSSCKVCSNRKRSQWYKDSSESFKSSKRSYQRNRVYGWSTERFDSAWALQGGACAICGVQLLLAGRSPASVHVDHDHETGDPRDLLCAKCNKALGGFGDNVVILQSAINYLLKHSRVKVR